MRQRLQITLDPKVYALIKNTVGNKSQFIEQLIIDHYADQKRDSIVEAVFSSIINDPAKLSELRLKLTGETLTTSEGYSPPEDYA